MHVGIKIVPGADLSEKPNIRSNIGLHSSQYQRKTPLESELKKIGPNRAEIYSNIGMNNEYESHTHGSETSTNPFSPERGEGILVLGKVYGSLMDPSERVRKSYHPTQGERNQRFHSTYKPYDEAVKYEPDGMNKGDIKIGNLVKDLERKAEQDFRKTYNPFTDEGNGSGDGVIYEGRVRNAARVIADSTPYEIDIDDVGDDGGTHNPEGNAKLFGTTLEERVKLSTQ
jgi:hypothetical protein